MRIISLLVHPKKMKIHAIFRCDTHVRHFAALNTTVAGCTEIFIFFAS